MFLSFTQDRLIQILSSLNQNLVKAIDFRVFVDTIFTIVFYSVLDQHPIDFESMYNKFASYKYFTYLVHVYIRNNFKKYVY